MLTIVGGTYYEVCEEPSSFELYGSGLRAAAGLSDNISEINFFTAIGKAEADLLKNYSNTFGLNTVAIEQDTTVNFHYFHPLSKPVSYYEPNQKASIVIPEDFSQNILFYGLLEANVKVKAKYLVHDPQNEIPFIETDCTAEHLALVLNKHEAYLLAKAAEDSDLIEVGNILLQTQKAEVVIIKNGSHGALVIEKNESSSIPVFDTQRVWPIGSGDIFSAVFAWQWMIEKKIPKDAALLASQFTANYCEQKLMPLPNSPKNYVPILPSNYKKEIYLAGPCYTISEKWLINELRILLSEFGNKVFSPFHEVISSDNYEIVRNDLAAIERCDLVFAVISGLDAGTMFEIGYAISLKIKIIALGENIRKEDLTMLLGSKIEIYSDLSTAVYKASW